MVVTQARLRQILEMEGYNLEEKREEQQESQGREGVDIPVLETTEETRSLTNYGLWERLSRIEHELLALKTMFEEKIANDAVKAELFSTLNAELERYREDFVFKHITSRVCSDLIKLFDRVENLIEQLQATPLTSEDLVSHLNSFRVEILQILKRQGCTLIESKASKFDESFQQAVDCKIVAVPEEDQAVLKILRRGFLYEGKVFRPEEVVVGKYVARKGEI
jgi:molecular chaperone GrpE (heat shock protein)